MIYIAFAVWILATVFAARGVLNLLGRLIPPKYLAWALLPGTLVAELAYLLAGMVTGAELHSPKLTADEGKQSTPAKGGVPYLTPLLGGLLPLAACLAAIYLVSKYLGHPVLRELWWNDISVSKYPPDSLAGFWDACRAQITLLQQMTKVLGEELGLPWTHWKAWLFEYLMICLVLRTAPARRPFRPVLAGVVILSGLTAALVAIFSTRAGWLHDAWPVLSYTWGTALLLLALALAISGLIALAKILAGKE